MIKNFFYRLTLVLSVVTTVFAQTGTASAAANYDLHAAIFDTPLFDNRDYSCATTSDGGETTGSDPTLAGNDNVEKAYRFFIGKKLTPANAAGILGNLIQESNVNPGAVNTAGGTGGSIAQWEGPRWDEFLAFAKKTGGSSHSLATQLNFMWAELTGTQGVSKQPGLSAMKGINDPADSAQAFELAYERAGDPRMSNRRDNAVRVYRLAARKGWNDAVAVDPTTPPATSTPVDPTTGVAPTGCTAVPVDPATPFPSGIVATAMSNLAWPKPACTQTAYGATRNGCKDPTPAYAAKGGTHTAPGASDAFTDCGIFVATVMHLSGADPKYPNVDTGTQLAYVKKHTEKYTVIPSPSLGQLQPADVLVYDGHTLIYLGTSGGSYRQSSASWHGHSPHLSGIGGVKDILTKPGVVAARLK